MVASNQDNSGIERPSAFELIRIAAWFGLLTGLVEGGGLFLFWRLHWLNWNMREMGVWFESLWVSTFFCFALFLVIGIIVVVVSRFLRDQLVMKCAFLVFAVVMFLDWLLLSGKVRLYAVPPLAIGIAVVSLRWFLQHEEATVRIWKRTLPWLAVAAVLVFAAVQGGAWWRERSMLSQLPPAKAGAPNVLVIVVDTLRGDHLSSYGYARKTSPHIDALAKEGVQFERAFSASSWTLPSHASILTGHFPHEHGAVRNFYDGRYPTLAAGFAERGYRTAAFSGNTFNFSRKDGFGNDFQHFEDSFQSPLDMMSRTVFGRWFDLLVLKYVGDGNPVGRRLAGDITDRLLRWLGSGGARPFFAFVNYFDPHDPYLPPQPYRNRFAAIPNPGGRINEIRGTSRPKLTPQQLQGEIDAYDGAIAYVDDQIGRLLVELKRRGFQENTIVVLTSDHGESFGEHGIFLHRTSLFREQIFVPLILRWPGRIPPNSRVAVPVSNASLAATLMELAGTEKLQTFPGPSLVSLWKNPEAVAAIPYPLSELSQMPFPELAHTPVYHGNLQSLVSSEWHYIYNDGPGAELFDWRTDPQEAKSLATTPEGQKVAAEFDARRQEMLETTSKLTKLSHHSTR